MFYDKKIKITQMNKSNRQYERNLTTNSYNQDFIYYKYSKQSSKSPKFVKHGKSYVETDDGNNHSKIQSMKNTLNNLFDPLSKGISKSFTKSVAEYDNRKVTQIRNSSKSVYEQDNNNTYLNSKLEILTSKLREIAQKPHFSTMEDFKKPRNKKQIVKASDQTYFANMSLIQKGSETKQHAMFEQLFAKQTKKTSETTKNDKKSQSNFSQQLAKSKSKIFASFLDKNKHETKYSNSQCGSLKRQPKNLKNDKSVVTLSFPQNSSVQFQMLQRPRGKTVTHLIQTPTGLTDIEPTKIKINSYLQKKTQKRIPSKQCQISALPQKGTKLISPHILGTLKPHRGPITSIIINSDGKRFLSASNDYSIKQSSLDGSYTTLRKHQGRVNVMRMIEDKLYTGGNDCRLRYENGSFHFSSPVLEVFPHQKEYINVGTNSSVELFNIDKKVSLKKISVKTKFYNLCQKINKDIYFLDNHSLSTIDWRVPFPLINLYQEQRFIQNWISDPYTLDFYQIRNKKLIYTNNSKSFDQEYNFDEQIKDYCWKRDKIYFITDSELQVFQNKRNILQKKYTYLLNTAFQKPSKLQIKNDFWIYGTIGGSLIVNRLQS